MSGEIFQQSDPMMNSNFVFPSSPFSLNKKLFRGHTRHLTSEHRKKISLAMMGKNKGRNKGRPPWNKGKSTPLEVRMKISNAMKGKNRGRRGTRSPSGPRGSLSQEVREKISKSLTGKKHSEEYKRKMSETWHNLLKDPIFRQYTKKISEAVRGEKNPAKRPEVRKKLSEIMKNKLKNDENYLKRMMRACNIRPNKTESFLMDLLNHICPNEYKYVGDGEVVIGGRCPDFMNVNGKKKLIELYGDYWHRNDDGKARIEHYRKYGFETLIIRECELEDIHMVTNKVLQFHSSFVEQDRSNPCLLKVGT